MSTNLQDDTTNPGWEQRS